MLAMLCLWQQCKYTMSQTTHVWDVMGGGKYAEGSTQQDQEVIASMPVNQLMEHAGSLLVESVSHHAEG